MPQDHNTYPIIDHGVLCTEGDFDVDDFVCEPFSEAADGGFEVAASFEGGVNKGRYGYVGKLEGQGGSEVAGKR
jgi:hypothetical protein